MTLPILDVQHLVKHFGNTRAVDGVSFAIPPGTCFGLLGPNGAGKTTTIEVIEGILTPTDGQILYKGKPRGRRFREEVGIQLQSTELLLFQSVRETLNVFRNLYDRQAPMEHLIEVCHLSDILESDNSRISGGQKQRLLLAMALANDPELVFLDEPTTGLDPQARRHLWDIVRGIKEAGRTVVLTTHYMEEAEILCDRIAIIDRGQIIAMGTTTDLLSEHGTGSVITFNRQGLLATALDGIHADIRFHKETVSIRTGDVAGVLHHLSGKGMALDTLSVRSFNLEDLFLKLTGRDLRS